MRQLSSRLTSKDLPNERQHVGVPTADELRKRLIEVAVARLSIAEPNKPAFFEVRDDELLAPEVESEWISVLHRWQESAA